jgi:hypothetical protein
VAAAAAAAAPAAAAAAAAAILGTSLPDTPLLVVLAGQRSADCASACRALNNAGIEITYAQRLGEPCEHYLDLTMTDAELQDPEGHPGFAALLASGRLQQAAAGGAAAGSEKGEGGGGGGGGSARNSQSCVLLAFDSDPPRADVAATRASLPLLGEGGRLEKLHAALLRAGVTPARIAFAGTCEELPEVRVFTPGASACGLAPAFARRLGEAQLALMGHGDAQGGGGSGGGGGYGYLPARFLCWQRECTPLQSATLRRWLGGLSAEVAMLHELSNREETALMNMMSNIKDIKAVVVEAQLATERRQREGGGGGGGGGGAEAAAAATAAARGESGRPRGVSWAEEVVSQVAARGGGRGPAAAAVAVAVAGGGASSSAASLVSAAVPASGAEHSAAAAAEMQPPPGSLATTRRSAAPAAAAAAAPAAACTSAPKRPPSWPQCARAGRGPWHG